MGGSRRTLEDVAMKEEMSERQDCPRENSVNDVAGKVRSPGALQCLQGMITLALKCTILLA